MTVLVFYFVIVCSPSYGIDISPSSTPMWDESRYACWTDHGPYFTKRDCDEMRNTIAWNEWGTSLCYARSVSLKGDSYDSVSSRR